MGYQEILIKSARMSPEDMAGIIQKKMDLMFIDQADTVAALRNDFFSNQMVVFGRQINTKPLDFKAGERFLVVCGERDALKNIKSMFPVVQRKSIEIYPMEFIMQSVQNLNKDYGEVFADSKITVTEKHKGESIIKMSVRNQLEKNRASVNEKNKDLDPGEQGRSHPAKDHLLRM